MANLPPPDDTRNIAEDVTVQTPLGPVTLPGRLATWAAAEFSQIKGYCQNHKGFGTNVGNHVPGYVRMCQECAEQLRKATPAPAPDVAPDDPLNMRGG